MFVATRRASLTPSSPAVSRRGSWADVPVGSIPSSRRASRVDLSINSSIDNKPATSSELYTGPSQAKLAINQLLSNLSQVSEAQARMSSPKGSRSPTLTDPSSLKRKYEPDSDSSIAYKVASATEIQLPSDPLRRASIINLATAAAAAVLQSHVTGRRISTHPEQEQKRQRVEQLGLLIEQARKASVGSMSHDMSHHVEAASQNVAIATVLANHLGLTPQYPEASTPSVGTPPPPAPTKAASTLAVSTTSTTPKSLLSSAPLPAARQSVNQPSVPEASVSSVKAIDEEVKTARGPLQPASPTSSASTPAITLNKPEGVAPIHQHQGFLDEAKEAVHTYKSFYRFEKEWAQKALELERRRSSIRIDPLFNPNPNITPSPLAAAENDDKRAAASPKQHSAPQSRIMSRGSSPFGDFAADPSSRTAHSVPNGSFSSSHRGSSSGLANVLSNFAELIEHRQRSCSGLEALAKQAKELTVKRMSQPNPQFRTTFGEFSWNRQQSTSKASPTPHHAIQEGDGEFDASSPASRGGVDDHEGSVGGDKVEKNMATHLQVKSEKQLKNIIKQEENTAAVAGDAEGDAPATPRSSMSIASML
ncbi:related to Hgl1p, required for dimorphism and teliospore formation [Melanopsichium pennsylvanicum]|uniref:Related to Hgl1p, required for dimorphism and teliospore formation n=2 Tax=Melanopsichium pennsylvanicum TaxID=63383 RepID=A0AAJ5C307_9BASI|nr:Hgl1p, required for dimorphism and teliospore formation [Melanopsichium pennsylvanicum 4]SNX81974.1 related to Hgl1p, required for dimorphism and teliospore formation [Melanopsichium pennsylvanicum]